MTIKALYQAYQRDIYGYLFHLTGQQSAAEDLTSEVFISAMKSLPAFQGNADIKTWLFSIARHKWYESIRREKRETSALERLGACLRADGPSVEDHLLDAALLDRVRALLDEEKERSRRVVLLRAEGYSFYEIAGLCGISEGSARVIDFRTRKKLRELLAKEGFSHE